MSNVNALSLYNPPDDPSELGFPHMLPVELALKIDTPKNLCVAYGIDKAAWDVLRTSPAFIKAVTDAAEMIRKEGMSFKLKAQMQSEALLKTSWSIIHSTSDEVPAAVKADLIKRTWQVAGLDASVAQKSAMGGGQQNTLSININLG